MMNWVGGTARIRQEGAGPGAHAASGEGLLAAVRRFLWASTYRSRWVISDVYGISKPA